MRGARSLVIGGVLAAVAVGLYSASAAGPKALDASYFFGSCDSCIQKTATISSFR